MPNSSPKCCVRISHIDDIEHGLVPNLKTFHQHDMSNSYTKVFLSSAISAREKEGGGGRGREGGREGEREY